MDEGEREREKKTDFTVLLNLNVNLRNISSGFELVHIPEWVQYQLC